MNSPKEITKSSSETQDISTYIPKGYRLVPLPIENYKSLDSILGNYGVVDLYVKTMKSSHIQTELIGSGIRAIRSKNGSESIGLLIPTEEVKNLLRREGPFFLTINNSQHSGTVFEKPKTETNIKNRIQFFN